MRAIVDYRYDTIPVKTAEDFRIAPTGIIAIEEYLKGGKVVWANHEWYWLHPVTLRFGTTKGHDAATACPPPGDVISKRAPNEMIPVAEYEAIMDRIYGIV